MVFAGYGITAPGYQYDDYAGLDAHDAIVLVLTQEPGEMDSTSRFDGNVNTPYADVRTKAINAREHGALGMLVVNGPKYHAGDPLHAARAPTARGYMIERAAGRAHLGGGRRTRCSAPRGKTLARGAGGDREADQQPHSFALPESVTLTVNLRRTRAQDPQRHRRDRRAATPRARW